jgi:hypothetical protein
MTAPRYTANSKEVREFFSDLAADLRISTAERLATALNAAYAEGQKEIINNVAGAFIKFAPDLAQELRSRYGKSEAQQKEALEEFLKTILPLPTEPT